MKSISLVLVMAFLFSVMAATDSNKLTIKTIEVYQMETSNNLALIVTSIEESEAYQFYADGSTSTAIEDNKSRLKIFQAQFLAAQSQGKKVIIKFTGSNPRWIQGVKITD